MFGAGIPRAVIGQRAVAVADASRVTARIGKPRISRKAGDDDPGARPDVADAIERRGGIEAKGHALRPVERGCIPVGHAEPGASLAQIGGRGRVRIRVARHG